ncbi:MAG: hypothetical protein IJD09_01465 [Clostridia bacterium]|nr:hypothetical protein [Clostridia bacterium]
MNIRIANALSFYFETVYELNRKIINICGRCKEDHRFDSYKLVLDVIQDIPRLIPFSFNKKNQKYELNYRNGLLEFRGQLDFLENDYMKILTDHYTFLEEVQKIRNKAEHRMHAVMNTAYGFGTMCLFEYEFNVEDNSGNEISILVQAEEFISLIYEINILFSKLQDQVKTYAIAANKTDYAYYKRLCRFDFLDFNKIYDSNLLELFGKISIDF